MAEWVLVADASRAILYERTGYKTLERIGDVLEPDKTPIDKEMGKPGRMREAAPVSGHVYSHKTDIREHEKRMFAHDIASMLKGNCDQFDQLIIIAAPLILGELRKSLDSKVQSKIQREIDKDLTRSSPDDLAEHLYAMPVS